MVRPLRREAGCRKLQTGAVDALEGVAFSRAQPGRTGRSSRIGQEASSCGIVDQDARQEGLEPARGGKPRSTGVPSVAVVRGWHRAAPARVLSSALQRFARSIELGQELSNGWVVAVPLENDRQGLKHTSGNAGEEGIYGFGHVVQMIVEESLRG
jgi:hypothetical protein